MMPPRYNNMHRTANTGPSSMMAAAVVTAATCAQEEKIQKHITPTNTEHSSVQKKKLCEMATQTITISNIFTNLDSSVYQQIPYADQYVPNNNHNDISDKEQQLPPAGGGTNTMGSDALVVANNNKINQQQHCANLPNFTSTAALTTNVMGCTVNGLMCATTTPLSISSNHVMPPANPTATTNRIQAHNNEVTVPSIAAAVRANTVLTTSL